MKTSIEQIKDLINKLNEATKYYEIGKPIMTDKEWDKLYFQLVHLEGLTGVYFNDSPTQSINFQVVNELKQVKHNHPMLSLDKTKDWNEFIRYFGKYSVIGMLKLDGLTCSLKYENGQLISAETRGNGTIGEDILHNALVIKNIPKKIDYTDELIVDGEIICDTKTFEQFEDEFANARNFAAGSIRLLDSKECANRHLKFILWNVVKGPHKNVIKNFVHMEKLGFTITPWTSSFDWDAKEFLEEQAKKLHYPIDGLVGRFDDQEFGESLGATGHHTKAAYAFKYFDEEYDTWLNDIEWTIGRTGVLTPIAVFQPVEIDGTIVERASLHNISIMKEILGTPYQGQTITIYKANQINPQVASGGIPECKADIEGLEFKIPEECPICGGVCRIEKENNSEILKCDNDLCEGKTLNKFDHFCGKKGLDIKGLSLATLDKLMEWGWLTKFSDLYNLSKYRTDWINQPGFGEKSVDRVLSSIESSKEITLDRFIAAIGIPLIGNSVAKKISNEFKNYSEFREAIKSGYDFTQLETFGYTKHYSIVEFDYSEADEVYNFLNEQESLEPIEQKNNLEGLTFVVTGKLKHYKNRNEIQKVIESFGGKLSSSVSKNTTALINNDVESNSSKNVTAKQLGIPILNEEDFIKKYLTL